MSTELERQTRKRRIDPRLKAAGWRIVPFVRGKPLEDYGTGAAVEEFETANGPADYALCDDGQVLGVVEAKKVTLGPHKFGKPEALAKGRMDDVAKQVEEAGGIAIPAHVDQAKGFSPPSSVLRTRL